VESTEGCGVVVEENRPFGNPVRRDYEPRSWWVRSRFSEGLSRNRYPVGIYRSELEEREVEEDCLGVRAEEGVKSGRDDGMVMNRGVWKFGCPRYHPRVGGRLLALVIVDNIGSLVPVVQRSPAGMCVIGWNGQVGCVQEGGSHPRVP